MALVVAQVTDILVEFVTVFGEVATTDPLSAILLLFGAAITLFSSAFLGFLAAGAALDAVSGDGGIGRSPPPEAR